MSIRSKLARPKSTVSHDVPIWVKQGSATTKALYAAASDELVRITTLIEKKVALSPKERRIIASRVAQLADRDKSIITPRRQPDFVDWLNRANDSLHQLYELHKTKKKPRPSRNPQAELTHLRKLVSTLQETNAKEFVERIFDSNLLDHRDKLASEIISLKRTNSELMQKIDTLQAEREKQDRMINLLLMQIRKN